jgi:5,10-methylenetetrahydromethanopterin reductase
VALRPGGRLTGFLDVVRRSEAGGFDTVWVTDHGLHWDVWSVLAAAASVTSHVRLGPGVVNPYTRHPASLAASIATLDELSGGRAILGIGAGGTSHQALGVTRRQPAAVLSESITMIRALLAGEEGWMDRGGIRASGVRLDLSPHRPDIPIVIGGRGRQVLEVGGRLADGVIVGNLAIPGAWSHALGAIDSGAAPAGRRRTDIELTAWLYCAITDDGPAAVDAVRPMVAATVATSLHVLKDYGLVLPQPLAELVAAPGWEPSPPGLQRVGELLSTELIDAFSLAGTPEACRRQLTNLLAAVPDIDSVVIVPLAGRGASAESTMTQFVEDVASGL